MRLGVADKVVLCDPVLNTELVRKVHFIPELGLSILVGTELLQCAFLSHAGLFIEAFESRHQLEEAESVDKKTRDSKVDCQYCDHEFVKSRVRIVMRVSAAFDYTPLYKLFGVLHYYIITLFN